MREIYESVQNNKCFFGACQAVSEIPAIITSIPTTVEMEIFIVVITSTVIMKALCGIPLIPKEI